MITLGQNGSWEWLIEKGHMEILLDDMNVLYLDYSGLMWLYKFVKNSLLEANIKLYFNYILYFKPIQIWIPFQSFSSRKSYHIYDNYPKINYYRRDMSCGNI